MKYLKHIITIITFHFSNHSYKVLHSSNKSHILTISAHVKNTQTHSHKDRHLFQHTAWSQTTAKNQGERIKETISYKNEFSPESADLMDRGRLHSLGATTSKARSSLVLNLERGTVRRPRLDDRRGQLHRQSVRSSAICRALNVNNTALKWILNTTGNQWTDARIGGTCDGC